jgi:vancomycin resistance protein YoaR
MSFQDTTAQHTTITRRSNSILLRAFVVAVSILVLLNLVALLIIGGYQLTHDGAIYPGVTAWGVDLSGMTPQEAREALEGQFVYPESTVFTFREGDQIWQATAGELGVRFDVDRTVTAAFRVGREGNLLASIGQQIAALRDGISVSPVVVYDQSQAETFVLGIAAQVDKPVIDATLTIENLEVVTTGSQVGRQVDVPATVNSLRDPISNLQSAEIPVVVIETQPIVADATDAAVTAQAILAEPLTVYMENPLPGDPGPWIAPRESLAEALVVERVPVGEGTERYNVYLNEAQLRTFLDPLVESLAIEPFDARFTFDEDTGQLEVIQNAVYGRSLNVDASVASINQVKMSGQHEVALVFDILTPPLPDTITAEELGITELVASSTTYFSGSSGVRRTNIAVAAARFHGIVIAPGEEFSFNQYLGDVSEDSGFEEGLIIYGNRTVKGVGGGVCQVSTTAFQTAFYAGFPIVERWPHGYRVAYYESGEGAGMDATVFSPIVDFRFINDSQHYLLIETYSNRNAATLTWKFYSTGDGRTVQKDGPYISNVVPHGPAVYEEDPDITPGTTKQVDFAVDGADATVYRTVYRDGAALYQDTFVSHYLPWQAVYQVAPGYSPSGANRESENPEEGDVIES